MSQQTSQGTYSFMSYSNINGHEQTIEKQFDSKEDYLQFMEDNNIQVPSLRTFLPSFFGFGSGVPVFLGNNMGKQDKNDQLVPSIGNKNDDLETLKKKKIEREQKKSQLEVLIKDAQELAEYFDKEGDKESAKKAKEIVKKYQDEINA